MNQPRPKSPSPSKLPAVGDTVVGLDPVVDASEAKSLEVPAPELKATVVDRPGVESTAPIEIPPQLRAKQIDLTTTPSTPLASVAPGLAAQLGQPLGASLDLTPVNPYPAVTPPQPPPTVTPIEPAPAVALREPAPALESTPFDEQTIRQPDERADGPRRSHPEMPAASGTERKSRTDVPAHADADASAPRRSRTDGPVHADADASAPRRSRTDGPVHADAEASAPRKSRTDVPALSSHDAPAPRKSRIDVPALTGHDVPAHADANAPRKSRTDVPAHADANAPRKSRTDVPALSSHDAPAPRKSRIDVPATAHPDAPAPRKSRLEVPAQLGPHPTEPAGSPEPAVGAAPRKSRIDAPALPGHDGAPRRSSLEVAVQPLEHPTEPHPAEPPSDVAEVPTDAGEVPLPPKGSGLSGDTVVKTLPAVPPVAPFRGLDDPRFKLGAMIAGLLAAVVLLSMLSWELLKHEPDLPADQPIRPSYVEVPAPPRTEQLRDQPAAAPTPVKQALQIEVQVDAGLGATKTVLVPAGTMHLYCDPEADAWVDGRDLGPQPVRAVLPPAAWW